MSTEASTAVSRLFRRRGGRRLAAAAAVAALAMTPGIANVQTAHAAAADDKPTFTIGMLGAVDSFNPFNGIVAESYEMWALMYDYMISWTPEDMSPSKEGGLAEDWSTSPDGLTWTFKIRDGVTWSDGEPLTANDIAYTYNRILDGGPEAVTWGSYLKSVDTVTAPDDHTVELKLSKPNAVLPLLPMPIIPEHIWKDVSEDDTKSYPNEPASSDEPVVGSGPFQLVEGEADGQIYRFVANDNYWGGAPNVGEIDFRVFGSQDTLVQALQTGDIDFAEGVTPLQIDKLKSDGNITTVLGDSPSFDEIAFNTGSVDTKNCDGTDCEPMGDFNPVVLDPKFRFALNFAINRQELIDKVYQGAGQPGTTIIPPAYSQWQWQPDDPDAFAYDPEKAKQLLDDAGYTVGSDGWRTTPDGDPIGKLRLYARSDSETSKQTMQYLKEWLAAVNIDSEVVAATGNKLTDIILDGNFDLFQWGWYVEPDPDSVLSYFTCAQRGGWSDSWYCNPTYDELYKSQHSETDVDTRVQDVQQMQQMLYDDAPYLVTAYSAIGEAYRSDRWEGFVPQPNPGGILLFQYGHANYLNLKPVSAGDTASGGGGGSSEGSSTGTTVAIVLVVLVVLAGGVVVVAIAMRRRATADTRE
jgi:peptide/nickel transport system substrate-binding protein